MEKYRENQAVEIRETEFSRVSGDLAHVAEVLNEEVSAMEAKLTIITRKSPTAGACDKLAEPSYETKLAQDIQKEVIKIGNLNERLNYLRNRVEL